LGRAPGPFRIGRTRIANEDLSRLRRREKRIYAEAYALITELATEPFMGCELRDEWAGARSLHFGRDRYRLIWQVNTGEAEIISPASGMQGDPAWNNLPGRPSLMLTCGLRSHHAGPQDAADWARHLARVRRSGPPNERGGSAGCAVEPRDLDRRNVRNLAPPYPPATPDD